MNVRGAIRDFEDQLKGRLDVLFKRVAKAVPTPFSSPSVSLRRTTPKSYASTKRTSKPSEIASTTRMRKFTPPSMTSTGRSRECWLISRERLA